jgi:hypothetical protein
MEEGKVEKKAGRRDKEKGKEKDEDKAFFQDSPPSIVWCPA